MNNRKNLLLTELKLEGSELKLGVNNGKSIENVTIDLSELIPLNYSVPEIWMGNDNYPEEFSNKSLVKFHTKIEYSSDDVKTIDALIPMDDLIKFISKYGKK